ncbi:MAG: ABC transporter permease [Nitrososphaera sp.]|nr:ABC transporter permease [Nitrososphaera sp.]
MNSFIRELRYGVRMLVKRPGYALVAIVTLALGIGANTAIFSLVNVLLLRPFPGVVETDELVMVCRRTERGGYGDLSYPDYIDYRDRNSVFSGIAAYYTTDFHLGASNEVQRSSGEFVSGNYFTVLGVKAALGSPLLPEDDRAGSGRTVAVISHRLWHDRFNADPNIIGKTVDLNTLKFDIVGVATEGFSGIEIGKTTDIWAPVSILALMGREPNDNRNLLASRSTSWLRNYLKTLSTNNRLWLRK